MAASRVAVFLVRKAEEFPYLAKARYFQSSAVNDRRAAVTMTAVGK
jgi:hypothetical protein